MPTWSLQWLRPCKDHHENVFFTPYVVACYVIMLFDYVGKRSN